MNISPSDAIIELTSATANTANTTINTLTTNATTNVTTAVIAIQNWWKLTKLSVFIQSTCVNYYESDPISFEQISSISPRKLFILSCPLTHQVYAYDAVAWSTYFAQNGSRMSPLTRQRIPYQDIWNCFLIARPYLPVSVCNKFQSTKLNMKQMSNNIMGLHPVSPLLDVRIYNFHSELSTNGLQKKWTCVYGFQDPRTKQSVTQKKKLTFLMNAKFNLHIQM